MRPVRSSSTERRATFERSPRKRDGLWAKIDTVRLSAGSVASADWHWSAYYVAVAMRRLTRRRNRCIRSRSRIVVECARGELVAEFTGDVGRILVYTPRSHQSGHERYLVDWAALRTNEPETLARAASHAQVAADYLARFVAGLAVAATARLAC